MEKSSTEKDVDSWMSKNNLPEPIKGRIKHSVEKKWHEIRTVDAENLIPFLPLDLQKDIKRYLCSELVKTAFASLDDKGGLGAIGRLDEKGLDAIYGRLKPSVYSKESCIIRRGEQFKEMCFVFSGEVSSDAKKRSPQKIYGEELLRWVASSPSSETNLPISNQTAKAVTEVEAFVLTAQDLKFLVQNDLEVVNLVLDYKKQLRTWAAREIQNAWRALIGGRNSEGQRGQGIITATAEPNV